MIRAHQPGSEPISRVSALFAEMPALHEFVEQEPGVGRNSAVPLVLLQQVEQEFAQRADLAHAKGGDGHADTSQLG